MPTVALPATVPLRAIDAFYSSIGEIHNATVRCNGKICKRKDNHSILLEVSSSEYVPALEPVQRDHDFRPPHDPPRIATFSIYSMRPPVEVSVVAARHAEFSPLVPIIFPDPRVLQFPSRIVTLASSRFLTAETLSRIDLSNFPPDEIFIDLAHPRLNLKFGPLHVNSSNSYTVRSTLHVVFYFWIYPRLGPYMNRQPGITDENSIHVNLQGTCNPVQNGLGIPRHGATSRQCDRETPRLLKCTEECFLVETCEGTTIPRLEPRRTQEKGKIMVSRYLGIHCFNDTELIRKPSGHLVEVSGVFMVLQWVNNSLKTSDEGKKFSKVKVQVCSEMLDVAESKIPDVGVCRSGTPTEGIGRKSIGAEPPCSTLDASRSGAPKGRIVPPAPDSDACRSDASGEGFWREVPTLDACRSGAPKGRIVPPAPDSDACRSGASGEGSWREVPILDACRSGASKIRIGLKSSGLEQLPDSGSPRNANFLAFDGTPRSGTARSTESATDMDACRSGAPRKRRRFQSPGYVSIPDSGSPRNANSLAFDGIPRSGTAVSPDTGSVKDVGRSGTSKGRIVPPAPDSDACRSDASEEGFCRESPKLEASRSGASKAGKYPRAPDSDASRSGASGKGFMRVVPNMYANRHASVNDSAKLDSNPNAPRQRNTEIMDDSTKPSGSAISHGDIVPQDTVNQSPGVSYPMTSSRPDCVDHAKSRLPIHRVRPFQPRKAKAKFACYACITQAAGTQTPRSVDSLLVPESGSCHTSN